MNSSVLYHKHYVCVGENITCALACLGKRPIIQMQATITNSQMEISSVDKLDGLA